MVMDGIHVMILALILEADLMAEPLLEAYSLLSLFCLSKKINQVR